VFKKDKEFGQDVKAVQERVHDAYSRIRLDLYAQVGMPEKRRAQSEVVEFVLKRRKAVA
jgi:hypothetical protein